jgi:hypothetical protein
MIFWSGAFDVDGIEETSPVSSYCCADLLSASVLGKSLHD